MSRSSKGPRRELQVLKRLKEASANPSSLLKDGNDLLEKANKIKGFLSKQKSRTTAASGKSEWLLVYQHLQEERESSEREMHAFLAHLLEEGCPDLVPDAKDCLASCKASADECRAVRAELKMQVKGISNVVASLRSYGLRNNPQDFTRECDSLNREIRLLGEDVQLQLQQLSGDAECLSAELAGMVQSALGAGSAGNSGQPTAATAEPQHASSSMAQTYYNSDRDNAELEAVVARHPRAAENVKHSIREVHTALQERFLSKLETWQLEWDSSGLAATMSGWAPEEHSQFVKLRERYYKEGVAVKGGREAAFARVAQMLPGRTVPELLVYDDLFVASKLLQRRRRDAVEAWARERRCFLQDSECFLEESARVNQAQAETAAQRLAHELVRGQVHEELHGLRAAKLAEWEAGAEARAAEEQDARAKQAAEAERLEKDQASRKEMIAAYRAELDHKLREEQAAQEAFEQEQEQARLQEAEVNKERVEWRHAEYQWKLQKQQERSRVLEELDQERQLRLERLRALVAPQVELDPGRVMLPTVASAAAAAANEEQREGDAAGAAAFKPVHGYTVTQLYKDPKFKLMDALQRQGLHNTDYGRQIILNANTVKATRPDNLTFMQRGAASQK